MSRYLGFFFAIAWMLALLGMPLPAQAALGKEAYDYSAFARIPVQNQGRIKPLDTFARSYLKMFSGHDALPDKSAISWLAEVVCDPDASYREPVFNIPNRDVVHALDLPVRQHHYYSFSEVSKALMAHLNVLHPLFNMPKDKLTLAQDQLLSLYSNMLTYADISHSFTMALPLFSTDDQALADAMGIPVNTPASYLDLRPHWTELQTLAQSVQDSASKTTIPAEAIRQAVIPLLGRMQQIERERDSAVLRVIPPQWSDKPEEWLSPWGVSMEGQGSPASAELIQNISHLAMAYISGDASLWQTHAEKVRSEVIELAGTQVSAPMLSLEPMFNQWDLFSKSMLGYVASFLALLASMLLWKKWLYRAAALCLAGGFLLHLTGVVSRMVIMGRPPVSSLYESIIFVGLIAVLFGVLVEWRRRNGMGMLVATAAGAVLQALGQRYAADGDTMGMLVAVLNTNFWLGTHVVTITIGYGCSVVGGVLAHIYLLQRLLRPKNKEPLAELYRNIQGVAIVALFFASLGTILGGIWADQSWGRFWGWDPKENGALLIVLWLALLIHGRLSGILKELGYALGMVMTNAVVAMAWFGVNLLNVGLHSYGFTRHVAVNLGLFCGGELLFMAVCAILILRREGRMAGKNP